MRHTETARHIREHGRSVIGVFPDKESEDINDAFAYTIGNSLKGLPELLVVGIYRDGGMLNELSERMIAQGHAFADNERVFLGGAFPVTIIEADDAVKERVTIQAGNFLKRYYRVMQIVLCDHEGRFPWDQGCGKPYCDVRVWRRIAS